MVTLLIESLAVKDFIAAVLVSTDPDFAMDGDHCPDAFADKLRDLLEGGIDCPDNDIYEYSNAVRAELKNVGICLDYAEGISIIPAANALLIHYDFSEPSNELRFQHRPDLLVRGVAEQHPRQRLQERQGSGNPRQRLRKPAHLDSVDARKCISLLAGRNAEQSGAVQLHQNPDGLWRSYMSGLAMDQGVVDQGSRVQEDEHCPRRHHHGRRRARTKRAH